MILVMAPTRVPLLTEDEFVAGAAARWRDDIVHSYEEHLGGRRARVIEVGPGHQGARHGFLLRLQSEGKTVTATGTDAQNADVAAWVRSLLPDDFPRLIVGDEAFAWHVDLTPDITPEQVLAGRVDHSDPDWSDPDLT